MMPGAAGGTSALDRQSTVAPPRLCASPWGCSFQTLGGDRLTSQRILGLANGLHNAPLVSSINSIPTRRRFQRRRAPHFCEENLLIMPSTIALAHARFPNLRADGILRRSATGPLIDTADIEAALAFLGRCRRNKRPNVHTLDLQHHVSRWAGRPDLGRRDHYCCGLSEFRGSGLVRRSRLLSARNAEREPARHPQAGSTKEMAAT